MNWKIWHNVLESSEKRVISWSIHLHSPTRPDTSFFFFFFAHSVFALPPDFLSTCFARLDTSVLRVWWQPLTSHATFGSGPITLFLRREIKTFIHHLKADTHTQWLRHVQGYTAFHIWPSVLLRHAWLLRLLSHGAIHTWLLTDRDANASHKGHLIWEIALKKKKRKKMIVTAFKCGIATSLFTASVPHPHIHTHTHTE